MILKIGWLHEAEQSLGTWLHEADDWHSGFSVWNAERRGTALISRNEVTRSCILITPPPATHARRKVVSDQSANSSRALQDRDLVVHRVLAALSARRALARSLHARGLCFPRGW